MTNTKMEWQKDDRKYAWGEVLLLGRWIVAGVHNSSAVSMNDPKKWLATCKLPGIRSDLGSYETAEEAKAQVEKAVWHWLALTS